jgi:hypothetical protein
MAGRRAAGGVACVVTVEPEFLDRASAASLLGIGLTSLDQLRCDGKLTPVYFGGLNRKPLYPLDELRELAAEMKRSRR